jgi:KUP system potassium uptake protein
MAEPQRTKNNGAANGNADSEYASEKLPPKRLQRFDSLHIEAGKIPGGPTHAAKVCSPATLIQSNKISFFRSKSHNCMDIFELSLV